MKFSVLPLLFFISTFTFSSALPVDYKSLKSVDEFQVRDLSNEFDSQETSQLLEMHKRDISALTLLFESLNNSATIELAKAALQLSATREQVCTFVGSFIEAKGLTEILEAADESGLALQLVLLFLTHYETIDGLIDLVDEYKDGNSSSSNSSSSSSSSSGGILSDLLGTVTSLLGLDSSSSSSSTSSSSSSTSSSSASSSSDSDSDSSSGGLLGTLLDGVGSLLGLDSDSDSSSSDSTSTTKSTSTTATATTARTATTSAATDALTTTAVTGTTSTSATTTDTTSSESTTSSSSGLLGDVVSGVTDIVSSLLGRDDLTEVAQREGLVGLLKREDVDSQDLMHKLLSRALDENNSELERRDTLATIYTEIISIIGTDSNVEEIFESLNNSGLAVNVVYNFIVDSDFYTFDIELYDYLIDNDYISLSKLWTAASDSGIIFSVLGDIIGNSTYISLVIKFVLAIFTGDVKVISLILAIFF